MTVFFIVPKAIPAITACTTFADRKSDAAVYSTGGMCCGASTSPQADRILILILSSQAQGPLTHSDDPHNPKVVL